MVPIVQIVPIVPRMFFRGRRSDSLLKGLLYFAVICYTSIVTRAVTHVKQPCISGGGSPPIRLSYLLVALLRHLANCPVTF